MFSACRASPPARRTIRSRTSSATSDAELRARRGSTTTARSSSECGSSSYSCIRDSSAELTSKYGFSRRRADQRHDAVLDRRQQRVLLRLVEAVDLVEEEDRALPLRAEPLAGAREHAAHVGDRGGHRRELLEGGSRRVRDDPRERRLAASRAGRRGSSSRPGPARCRCAAPSGRRGSGAGRRTRRGVCGRTRIASGATSGSRSRAASENRSPIGAEVCSGGPWPSRS